jgi:hypothetical protein
MAPVTKLQPDNNSAVQVDEHIPGQLDGRHLDAFNRACEQDVVTAGTGLK